MNRCPAKVIEASTSARLVAEELARITFDRLRQTADPRLDVGLTLARSPIRPPQDTIEP